MEVQPIAGKPRNNGRLLYISGEINELVAQDVNIELLKLQRDDPFGEVTLVVDSYGGELFAALAIHDMMKIMTYDIKTICVGKAMSAGQFIFSSGTRGKRYMSTHSRLMIHQPIAGTEGSVKDIEVEVEELVRQRDLILELISDNSKLSHAEVKDLIDRNVYLNAEEAIGYGFADHILTKLH